MTDFTAYSATLHPIVKLEDDYNNILDHALEKGVSYIIRKNGSTYEAINGSTGKIDYSSADAATVIQQSCNALTAGRTTTEKIVIDGSFNLGSYGTQELTAYNSVVEEWDYGVLVPNYTEIEIQGKITSSADIVSFLIADSHDIWIHGGTIKGSTSDDSGIKIAIINSYNCKVSNVNIIDSTIGSGAEGILIDARSEDADIVSYCNTVENCYFSDIGDYAIYVGHARNNTITKNTIQDTYKGITVTWDSSGNIISENHLDNQVLYPIFLQSQAYLNSVTNNVISNSQQDSIYLQYNIYNNLVSGNIISDSAGNGIKLVSDVIPPSIPAERGYVSDGNVYENSIVNNQIYNSPTDGIVLSAHNSKSCLRNLVSGNTIHYAGWYYIREIQDTGGICDRNTYQNNRFNGFSTYKVLFLGANNIFDKTVTSAVLNLDGGLQQNNTYFATAKGFLVGYDVFYTEATSADATAYSTIGMYNVGAAIDTDYYDTIGSVVNATLGQRVSIPSTYLENLGINYGDIITVGTAGTKEGAGELLLVLKIVEGVE